MFFAVFETARLFPLWDDVVISFQDFHDSLNDFDRHFHLRRERSNVNSRPAVQELEGTIMFNLGMSWCIHFAACSGFGRFQTHPTHTWPSVVHRLRCPFLEGILLRRMIPSTGKNQFQKAECPEKTFTQEKYMGLVPSAFQVVLYHIRYHKMCLCLYVCLSGVADQKK